MNDGFRLTPRARADLDAIADYTLAVWGERQMAVYIRALMDRMAWLAANPALGRPRPEIDRAVRSYREGSHLIFYRTREEGIDVIGLPHQAMDIETYF